ncbi:MAG TPA: DoxX family protein [Bryobacteraceae bacterium]|nr:DoxX family protein [Bryobacteraceae bacterium]
MATLVRLYRLLISLASRLDSPFLLIVRLYWGVQMAQTGWGKLHNLDRVTNFFTSLGIPAPGANAIFIAVLEFVGGVYFALGFGSRLVALLFTCDMLVAYYTADREALLSVFSDPDKFYAATPYTYLVAALIVLIFGPGLYSLDALLERRLRKRLAASV